MDLKLKHAIVEEAKGDCSVAVSGAPLGYFEEQINALFAQGITSTLALIAATAQKMPDARAVIVHSPSGTQQLTYTELLRASRQLAQGLIEGNYCTESLYDGKKIRMIAIFLDDGMECFVADYAAQYVPAVTLFLNARQEDTLLAGLRSFPIDTIIINARYCELVTTFMEQKKCRVYPNLVLIEEIAVALKERLSRLGVKTVAISALQANSGDAITMPKMQPLDPLTILSTSGSTGEPKFVIAPSRVVVNMFVHRSGKCLPLGEPYYLGPRYPYSGPRLIAADFLAAGNTLVLATSENIEDVLACFRAVKPAALLFPPIYLSKTQDYALKFINDRPEAEVRRILAALEKKIAFVKETKQLTHPDFDVELQPVRTQLFGTNIKCVYWTGAPISEESCRFFRGILNCPLLGVYGQVDIAGTLAIQEPFDDATIIGHITSPYVVKLLSRPEIGYSVDDVIEGKKCPRGELMLKGPLCLTYYNKDADYKKLFYEGEWFRTNDIMQLDLESLSFRIIDRGNNVLRPLFGTFIAVAEHERVYEQSSHVRQICVYIEATSPTILAIVVPHEEHLMKFAASKGIQGTLAELCRNEVVQKAVLEDLRAVATIARIDPKQQVIGVILSPTPFTMDNGLLTSTQKIRRSFIYLFYKDAIQTLRKQLEAAPTH